MYPKIGILGGGQLGRMLQEKALEWGLQLYFLDPDKHCSCSIFKDSLTVGSYKDFNNVMDFGNKMDVISIEIEHVNIEALEVLEKMGKQIIPNVNTLKIIQNKALQKNMYAKNEIPTSDFHVLESHLDVKSYLSFLPAFQKTQKDGYDGKGVQYLTEDTLHLALEAPSILEKPVDLEKELAITFVKSSDGSVVFYPICEMVFDPILNLVQYLIAPATISNDIALNVQEIALKVSEVIDSIGVFSIEFFLTKEGDVLVNEMAPRAHNSAHYTIEACNISQFDAQLRTFLNYPIPNIKLNGFASMINLIGDEDTSGIPNLVGVNDIMIENAYLHLYGKSQTKPGRKMGHLTILDDNYEKLVSKTKNILSQVKIVGDHQIT
jgi:5-(carboxyamino)imidazole ribonucleotide synthase